MAIVVESSVDQAQAALTGEVIQPADVIADNALKSGTDPVASGEAEGEQKTEANPSAEKDSTDEDENGLTAAQRAELTEKMQKAIGKKHRALREAEEFAADQYNQRLLAEKRAEQHEREANRLKAQLNGNTPNAVKDEDDGKPDRAKFETDEAYQDAVIDWRVDQRLKAQEAEQQKKAQEDRQRETLTAAQNRIQAAMEVVPDYAEVLGAADQVVPPHIAAYMQRSPLIAELGYYFAKNPAELERLADLPADEALVDIGEIKSKLKPFAKAEPAAKDASTNGTKPSTETGSPPSKPRVAAPIKPLGSGSALQVEKDETAMNVREVINDWSKRRSPALMRRARH